MTRESRSGIARESGLATVVADGALAMCGIAGILHRAAEREVTRAELASMNSTLTHRGPDSEGYFTGDGVGLAMRRLAVIDLVTGEQPIANEDGSVWVVLNGEIYNFPQLRSSLQARGHQFRTNSDTEALVHLYEDYGHELVNHLNGMFAFALWDRRRRCLLLARDRLGVKPLYFADLGDRLVFASEIKALLAAGVPRDLDRQALHHYLSLGYVPAPLSIFRGVRKLEAGHRLMVRDGRVEIQRYWDLPSERSDGPPARDARQLEEELRALMTDAVRIRTLSDVPLGTFLSGGLDSASIVSLLAKISPIAPKTFSVGFNDSSYDELPDARRVSEHFRTQHHEARTDLDASALLPILQHYFDEPFADPSALPTYQVCRMAREAVTVALGGDGGDEVFAGYYTYQADRLHRLYGHLPHWLRAKLLPALSRRLPVSERRLSFDFKLRRFLRGGTLPPDLAHYAWKEWFDEHDKHSLYAQPDAELEPTFSVFERHYANYTGADPLNRHLYVDFKLWLADDILVKVDRMSMATSLEVRGPFLDYRLAEFLARLPGRTKMPGFALKHLLKRVMRADLPGFVLSGAKRGFNVPLSGWIRRELREFVGDTLSPAAVQRLGIFRPQAVQSWLQEHWRGTHDHARPIWILLMFTLWHDHYMRAN